MAGLSSADIVSLWDRGDSREHLERGLLLLAASGVEVASSGGLTISERDARLMTQRRRTFGEVLLTYVECPSCGQRIESSVAASALTSEGVAGWADEAFERPPFAATIRPAGMRDLAAVRKIHDPSEARAALVARCVLAPTKDGASIDPSDLPEEIVREIAARLEVLDPLVDVSVGYDCPACSHRWALMFDVSTFLWSEVAMQAKRLIREVRALASAYGWHEHDILAMGPARRRAYLETTAP